MNRSHVSVEFVNQKRNSAVRKTAKPEQFSGDVVLRDRAYFTILLAVAAGLLVVIVKTTSIYWLLLYGPLFLVFTLIVVGIGSEMQVFRKRDSSLFRSQTQIGIGLFVVGVTLGVFVPPTVASTLASLLCLVILLLIAATKGQQILDDVRFVGPRVGLLRHSMKRLGIGSPTARDWWEPLGCILNLILLVGFLLLALTAWLMVEVVLASVVWILNTTLRPCFNIARREDGKFGQSVVATIVGAIPLALAFMVTQIIKNYVVNR